MILVWLKFIHVIGIAAWSAGLLALPVLYRQRAGLEDMSLFRLHAFTRTLYVGIISPAAFIAIGSGTALILMQGTYENWFSAKLVGVAAMTVIHIFSGLQILKLFEPNQSYPAWRVVVVMTLTLLVVSAILTLVLAKPEMEWPQTLDEFFAPGALSQMAGWIIGGTI
jgi:protoporphyrinogen IX oxidase